MSENIPQSESGEAVEKAIGVFWDYLNIREEPDQADAIFVLGGSSEAPVEKAADLYERGFAPKIAFISVGGRFGGEKIWGMPENEKYRTLLQEHGIPEDAVVSEGVTTNTLDEARAAIPFLKDRGVEPRTVILVSRPVHQRRAYATFLRQHPEIRYINCPADEVIDVKDPDMRMRLVQEAERLLDYAEKGDIEGQDIPRDVLKAAATIRRELRKEGVYTPRIKQL